jgi:hypothetical protein
VDRRNDGPRGGVLSSGVARSSRIVGTAVGVIAVAATLGFYGWIWPWMAFPPEDPGTIAARWVQVEAEAGRFGPGRAASPRLATATATLASWPAVDRLTRDQLGEPIAAAGLDPAASAALGELLAWAEERGGIGDDCPLADHGNRAPPFQLVRLAHLGIRVASGPEDPPLVATLRLAAELRRHGTALGAIVGFTIAADAVSFAQARGWAPGAAFRELRPTASELRAFPAREMLCADRQAALMMAQCEPLAPGEAPPWRLPWSEQRWCERERLTLRWFYGERYAAAVAETDLSRFGAALDLPDDGRELPASLVLRALWLDTGKVVAEMAGRLASYDAYLATEP